MLKSMPLPERHATATMMAARLEQIVERLHGEVARLTEVGPTNEAATRVSELRQELQSMATLIADTRSEVAGLLPAGEPHTRLTSASDELDAVVDATERAAVDIMNAAEQAQEAVHRLRAARDSGDQTEVDKDVDVIDNAILDIFMACSFQDLTGQRIRKVVQALTYIEKRVIALSSLWQESVDIQPHEAPPTDTRVDSHLLNGPSAAGLGQGDIDSLMSAANGITASSQDDIDALFA